MEEFSILSKSTVVLCFILHAISTILIVGVRCQANTLNDFINIDCGYEGEDYKDTRTGLTYKSDASLIDRGVTHKLSEEYANSSFPQQLATLRSFPDDIRICYALPDLVQNAKYLIRASFMYGNYDGLNSTPIQFDLHLGVNLWKKMDITSPSGYYTAEVLTVAESHLLTVCLVKSSASSSSSTGTTPPLFISALELRPLETDMYPAVNVSNPPLVLNSRQNMGASAAVVRYPDDLYDRIWVALNSAQYWRAISTTEKVRVRPDDPFRAPPEVLRTAVVPADNNTSNELDLYWDAAIDAANGNIVSQYHIFIYFAELSSGTSRTFNIYLGDSFFHGPFTPGYLLAREIYTTKVLTLNKFLLSIQQDKTTSMYPPILNALETYTLMSRSTDVVPTDATDVAAIMKIKEQYQLKRNWMGDPCAPKLYSWHGLDCSYVHSSSPRIIALNLSSSGLTGELADAFGDLRDITNLDLSENSLTGTIPEFLANIPSLKVLNLSGNNLAGSVPSALLSRSASHSLLLSVAGNPSLCIDEASCPVANKSKKTGNTRVVVSAIISILLVMLLLFLVLCIYKMIRRRNQQGLTYTKHKHVNSGNPMYRGNGTPFQVESLQFTYLELQKITNDFKYELGKGGFGSVYHGRLESGTEVAVKLRSQVSAQGTKEFMAEVELLMRIHHRNLVSLVGYCNDGNSLALVYEYMSEGNLAEHLRGKRRKSRGGLCWEERLQIAVEAAEGLDYLHKGCDPPIVHRDVKSSNILLHKNHLILTKIADFGLSKVFHNINDTTHLSTGVAGTPGYLDPEYHCSFQLTRKSDVYSFGVVLLELVTGKPPIIQLIHQGAEAESSIHIVQWIRPWLAQGDIGNLVDETLQLQDQAKGGGGGGGGGYSVDAAWMVIDLALKCTAPTSAQRPDMASVVAQLKEALLAPPPPNLESSTLIKFEEAPPTTGFTMEMSNMSESRVSEISLFGAAGPSAR